MKRNSILKITLLLILTITLTGCNKTAVDKALNNTASTKNYKADTTLTIGFAGQEPTSYTIEANVDNKSNLSYVTAQQVLNEETITHKMYYNSKNNELYLNSGEIYENPETQEKLSHNFKNNMSYLFDVKTLQKILEKPEKISKESGYYKVTVKANKLVNELDNILYLGTRKINLKKPNSKNISFNVYVDEDEKVTRIDADLTDLFKSATKITDALSEISYFAFTISYSKYDSSSQVEIPEEIKKDAYDIQEINAVQDAYLYMSSINSKALKDAKYTKGEKLNNIKPDKVNLELKDGKVTNGTITINKFKFTVKDGEIQQ